MVNQLFLVGMTVKSEPFYLSQENYYMLLLMHIYTELVLLLVLLIVLELFQEDLKVKLEYGKLEDKLRLCKLRWKNTEEESGLFKLEKIMNKLFQPLQMDLVLFGILNHLQDLYVYLNLHYLNKFYTILKNLNYWQQDLIEKSHIGKLLMELLLEC